MPLQPLIDTQAAIDHPLGVFAFYSGDQLIASMTFDQGCDLAALAAEQEITLFYVILRASVAP